MPNIGHGIYFSAAAHGGLVLALVLGFAAPRPFAEIPQEAVEVEVMTEPEAAKEAKQEEPSPPTLPAEAKPELRPSQRMQTAAATPAPPMPAPGATLPPAPPRKPPEPSQPAPAEGQFSAFDTANLAQFYNLRPPIMDFDSPATQTAKLSGEETTEFRAHLRRCWRQPAGVAPSSRARVVIRVSLTPDGALAAEPTLIEASASGDGPLVYKAALQALTQCQPFQTLPRERYREWKVLDVSFSSQEMAGG